MWNERDQCASLLVLVWGASPSDLGFLLDKHEPRQSELGAVLPDPIPRGTWVESCRDPCWDTLGGTLQCHGSPGLAATRVGPGKWERTSSASSEVVVRSLERFPKPQSCKRGCGIFLLVCLLLEVGATSSPSAGHGVFICCCSRVVAGFEMLASIKGK